MKQLMELLYGILSKYAVTTFNDVERDSDGVVTLDEVKITYSFDGILQLTDNLSRKDIPLVIDVWYRTKEVFSTYELVGEIDKKLQALLHTNEDGAIINIARDTNFINDILDTDPNIRRIQLRYNIRYYR